MSGNPALEPYGEGMLDVGDGQLIYWSQSGSPSGKPAVALHGGPGSGSSPGLRSAFAGHRYRLIQFDQRGCGRSTPSAANPGTDMTANTTHHLVSDIERLREHLGIERWLVWGASWGCTLGLAYAQRYPASVTAVVLVSVTVTRRRDIRWLYHDVGRYFPEEWARFSAGAGDAPDLVAAYDRLLNGPGALELRAQAARDWCDWEDAVLSNVPGWSPHPRYEDPAFRMTFARTCAHYFAHGAWLGPNQLLANSGRLAGIPAALIHGRFDLGAPRDVPWLLARAWPEAQVAFVDTGHQGGPEMSARIDEALARFA